MCKNKMSKIKLVIASQFPNERIKKIARSLKYSGNYQLTLLCCESGKEDIEYINYFDKIYFVTFIDKIIDILKQKNIHYKIPFILRKYLYKIRDLLFKKGVKYYLQQLEKDGNEIVYAFDASARNFFPYEIIKNTKMIKIYDSYDLASIYGKEILKDQFSSNQELYNEFKLEKYCLENADAFIFKYPKEILEKFKSFGYSIKGQYLYYADYCIPENFIKIDYNKDLSDKIKLAFIGPVANKSEKHLKIRQHIMPHRLIKITNEIKLYFNLYSQSFDNKVLENKKSYEKKYNDFYLLEQSNLFKVKGNYNGKQLIYEISSNHFGLNHVNKFDYYNMIEYGNQNKLANYLEAGLPMISFNEMKHIDSILKKYNIGFSIELKDLNKDYFKSINYKEMLKSIELVRYNEYNLYKNAPRLDKFIQELIGNQN